MLEQPLQHLVPVISLNEDLPIFHRATSATGLFQLFAHRLQVGSAAFKTGYNRHSFATPVLGFKPNAQPLLTGNYRVGYCIVFLRQFEIGIRTVYQSAQVRQAVQFFLLRHTRDQRFEVRRLKFTSLSYCLQMQRLLANMPFDIFNQGIQDTCAFKLRSRLCAW